MSPAIGFLLGNLARLSKKPLIPLFSIFTLLLSLNGFAANGADNLGRADYDLDDNGLIEINDLADLDEIRNNLDGKTLYGSNVGCPNAADGTVNSGCIGFELTADLDFDTSGDGVVNSDDDYRNRNNRGIAEGWLPIGDSSNYFSTNFNGNGHVIKNLTISRPSSHNVGLFGYINGARIESLAIIGTHNSVVGRFYVGALVGTSVNSLIRNVSVGGYVQGESSVAGLGGHLGGGGHIENSFVSGSVSGEDYLGGLVGRTTTWGGDSKNSIIHSLSVSIVSGPSDSNIGGLIGSDYNTDVISSYWSKNTSGQDYSAGSSEASSYVGLNLAVLQCAAAENTDSTTGCVSADGSDEGLSAAVILYKNWDPAVWGFGIDPNASEQLPGLKFNGQVIRDNDADGVFDEDDSFPNNRAASQDLDTDGYPDAWLLTCDEACIQNSGLTFDHFPNHAWAAVDADFDGLPDGAENCVSECIRDGLAIDSLLGDYDNDGILDSVDTDEYGVPKVDMNGNGLIDIDSLDKLNAMRYQLQGIGLQLEEASTVVTSGCPFLLYQGNYQQRCFGYELTADLDFDTNANGEFDSGDAYWNENSQGVGEGWQPVGIYTDGHGRTHYPFNAQFNGNGYVIENLTINRPDSYGVGLFGMIRDSTIENLAIAGVHSSVVGFSKVGVVAGYAENSQILKVFIGAKVQGDSFVAGLVGNMREASHVEDTIVSGSVSGNSYIAGLAGSSGSGSSISQSLSTANIVGDLWVGGLVSSGDNTRVVNSYWAKDSSGQNDSDDSSEANSYVGLDLVTLQCATAENTDSSTGCVSVDGSAEGLSAGMILYKDWNPEVWDFGSGPTAGQQLPGLKLNSQVLRDSDGDGVSDEDDVWPNNHAVSKDLDADGYPDAWTISCDATCIQDSGFTLDRFPQLAGAWLDADHDGLVDEVNPLCTVDCDIPAALMDPSLSDYDNDTILDDVDTDENNDGKSDVDADHDGLIDIDSLDKLNAMRFQLQGVGLQLTDVSLLEVSGCPFVIFQGAYQQRCSGYELTQNLDFDTNGNGEVDSQDAYWNANGQGIGEGWLPVGDDDINSSFTALFNGNGYAIKNLTINRPRTEYVGLFGFIENARVESLAIAGTHSSVVGYERVGALVGYATFSQVSNIAIAANVQGQRFVAGLVGSLSTGSVENSFVSGSVRGNTYIGGLVGSSGWFSSIGQSLSTSIVTGNGNAGGLIGSVNNSVIINSYWVTDTSTQLESSETSEANSYVGLNLSALQCAVAENTDSSTGCVSVDGSIEGLDGPVVLYKNWDPAIWNFGTEPNANQQLPGLKLNGLVLRDGDGDGVLDQDDKWPNNRAVSQDFDDDGYPDAWSLGCDDACIQNSGLTLDHFPRHAWAALDADFDGLPDGAENCVSDCELDGLTKDSFLGDYDNDGILDAVDTDENNDGINDVDADHNGLIEIDSLEKLNAMRFQLLGVGLQLTDFSSVEVSGCPFIIYQGLYQQRCSGYELTQDLDFDTNRNGEIDSEDLYWNASAQGVGEGWLPIGKYDRGPFRFPTPFSGKFNGNGYAIKNLTINRPGTEEVGLFGYIQGAKVENLAIVSTYSSVIGSENVGALVGIANNSLIRNIAISAKVQGYSYVGGLAGKIGESTLIENGFVSGSVSGGYYAGGLVGYLKKTFSHTKNSIVGSLSTSIISGDSGTGGLVGFAGYDDDTDISNSYWAKDISGQQYSKRTSEANSYVGLNLLILKCAIAENTDSSTGCVSVDGSDEGLASAMVLFNDWDPAIWYFGNENQLPGLIINSVLYQDSDGDGLFDSEDVMAFDYDNDGSIDTGDFYPLIAVGSLDTDHDGIPNDCDQTCLELGMVADIDDDNDGLLDELDGYPLIALGGLADFDNDGIPDNCDQACLDSGMLADTDDDNDGSLDTVDAYPFIAVGSLDTDFDGIPNDCDQTCLDLGMIADIDDDNDGLLDELDSYPLIALGGLADFDSDGIPNDCDQACLDLGMLADIDNDNDGSIDSVDAYPLIAAGSLDTDLDGIPNDCNQACLDLGMVADTDDDNDGLLDEFDGYPLIAIGALADFDNDGIPNDCDQACLDLGMIADADDDNDGVLDVNDGYRLIAIGELTDTDNDGIPNNCDQACLDLGMLADNDNDNDGSINSVDAYPLIAAGSLDSDLDGIPNDCDQTCLDLGMAADADDDNDGLLDEFDGYPLIAIGALADFDNDGIPNDCDQACLDLGMIADVDDDNDGVLDVNDGYRLIAIGELTDTDNDGIPNNCDQACLDLGMAADADDDNDGSIDSFDAYPLIAAGSLDTDRDGIPNDCDQTCLNLGMVADMDDDNDKILDALDGYPLAAIGLLADFDNDGRPDICNQACISLGMAADTDNDNDGIANAFDAFEFNAAASIDSDNDGLVDDWNANCSNACQLQSGLVLDSYTNDTDNDGATNDVDSDFENDNGKPILLTAAPTLYASVNANNGAVLTLTAIEVNDMFAALSAEDVVDLDASLSFKAYFNNAELVRDNDGQLTLPSGLQVIDWVAVDQAGNESEPLTQQLFIYPQVRFKSANSIIGEASNAEIIIELSGDSPEYPVIIEVSVDAEASSVDQADLAAEFDISSVHTLSIEQGDDAELLNKQVSLFVPVKEDNESENDELLVIELNSVMAASEGDATFLMDENKKVHELTVTYQNLAPTVQLLIKQAGVEVSDIQQQGGDVTITAIITDGNGNDEHSLIWDLNALGLDAPLGRELTFNPEGLAEGVYELSVGVTDNNPVNPLSASIDVSIQLLAPVVVPPVDTGTGSSGGSSGGAMFWLLILMSAALVYSNRRYKR